MAGPICLILILIFFCGSSVQGRFKRRVKKLGGTKFAGSANVIGIVNRTIFTKIKFIGTFSV